MDLTPLVDSLRREFAVAAEAAGEDAVALAERLSAPLESAIRLTLLDALSSAADEITRDLAPGSVEIRLRRRDPEFAVTLPAEPADDIPEEPVAAPVPETDDGTVSRINLRLPEQLKQRIEEAAGREKLSVNAWLVRAAGAALGPDRQSRPRTSVYGNKYSGWVR